MDQQRLAREDPRSCDVGVGGWVGGWVGWLVDGVVVWIRFNSVLLPVLRWLLLSTLISCGINTTFRLMSP